MTGALCVAHDITERREWENQEHALSTIATLVAGAADPAAVFAAVAARLGHLFDASVAAVTRFDAAANRGHVVGGWSINDDDPAGSAFSLDGAAASAAVFRTGRPARFDTPNVTQADPAREIIERYSITAAIAAPITVGGALWGTIGVAFSDRPCPPRAEQRLQQFAHLVSLAISNAEALSALAQQASTDAVTGLANYRTFHARLHTEVERARRYGRPLSLVLLDIDHFKLVNDAHGHQIGDQVLSEVARRLSANARDGEVVARIGGEEFAWLMPETMEKDAYLAADRVRRAIEGEAYADVATLTVSAGVCAIDPGSDADELFRRADIALYTAKDRGRNVVLVYDPDIHRIPPRR